MSLEIGQKLGSWDDVLHFVVVARERSFSRASRVLNLDRTTIGRRVTALEGRLGARLFIRQGKLLELTTFGSEALAEAEKIASLVSGFERRLGRSGGALAGSIRISSTEGVGTFWLLPRLRAFQAGNPDLEIELSASDTLSVLGRDADIALRMAPPADPCHVSRRVGTIPFRLYATGRYQRDFGLPTGIADFPRHRFIDHSGYHRNPALSRWNAMMRKLPRSLRTDSAHGLMQAVRAGFGIALCPTYAVHIAQEIGCPDLIELDVDFQVETGVWVVFHEDQRHCRRVRAMVDELYRLFLIDLGAWFKNPDHE